MTVGLAIAAGGLAWLTQIGVQSDFWVHVAPQEILMSVGLGLAFPAFSSTALTRVHDRDAGVASALVNTTQQIGGSLGTALLNTLAATATASYIVAHGGRPPRPVSSTVSPWPSRSVPASSHSERSPVLCSSPPDRPRSRRRRVRWPAQRADDR